MREGFKKCNICLEEKAVYKFPWNVKSKGWRKPYCLDCQPEYYRRDKERRAVKKGANQ